MKYLLASVIAAGLMGGVAVAERNHFPRVGSGVSCDLITQHCGGLAESDNKEGKERQALLKENKGDGEGVTDQMMLNDFNNAVKESGF